MLLDSRREYLPFEYPQVMKFVEKINHSYWLHTEINFDSDLVEFSRLGDHERGVIKRAMLAISQVEVSVKTFWGNIFNTFPKPEFHNLAMTHGESEVRHGELYSRLLTLLGFEKEFKEFLNNETARDRFNWLTKSRDQTPSDVVYNIAIFAMLMENVSLFSQFLIMLSYRRHLGVMKNIANGVGWTAQDETTHYETGAWLVQQMRSEYPEIDSSGFAGRMREVAKEALGHEIKMVDYILSGQDLNFLSKDAIIEFVKDRLNRSLKGLAIEPVFECNGDLLKETNWFYLLTSGTSHKDFFDVRPVEYAVKDVVFSHDELF